MIETKPIHEKLSGITWRHEAILFLSCSVSILLIIFFLYKQQSHVQRDLQETQAKFGVQQSSDKFSRDLKRTYSDIQFLTNLEQARSATADSQESLDALADIFIDFAQTQKRYFQIRMLNREGMEIIRINWNGEQAERVTGDELQDKSKRDYFQKSLPLLPGETFISNLNLNREHGIIEQPWKPVIRVVSPVQSETGKSGNLIILNYDCMELFEELSSSISAGNIYLIRNDGYFIIGPSSDAEWGWELGHDIRLGKFYPGVDRELKQTRADKGVYWSNNGLFAYAAVRLMPEGNDRIKSPLFTYWFLQFIPPENSFSSLQSWGTGLFTGFAAMLPLLILTMIWYRNVRRRHRDAIMARKQLEQAEAKLRGIFDNSTNLVGLLQPDGTLIDINETALASTNVPIEHLINKPFWETPWWTHSTQLQEKLKASIHQAATGKRNHFEMTYTNPEGNAAQVEFTVSPIFSNEGEVIYLIPEGHDVTLYKIQEEKLQSSFEKLEETNRELDQFAYIASHDLRSPLRGIAQTASFIIEDEDERLSESSKYYFKKLQIRVNRMQNLLDDLLAYSRIGRIENRQEQIDLSELIKEVLEMLSIPEGFKINVQDGLPTFVTCTTPLRQILLNLFSNALKHHDKSEGQISLSLSESAGMFEFRITDDGPGIEKKYHEQIFEAFRTLKPRDDVEGSGIGLAIILKLVRRYGGDISVESTPGQGTTFIFTWPRTIPTEITT